MQTVYFVRHAETACSAAGVLCGGQCEAPLSAAGRLAASNMAEQWRELPCNVIVSSSQRRAVLTAEPMAVSRRLSVEVDPRLREIDYGTWDGRHPHDLAGQHSEAFAAFCATPDTHPPPGGETVKQVAERAWEALSHQMATRRGGALWVFSHKTTLRALLCHLLGIPVSDYKRRLALPLGSLSVVDFLDSGPILRGHALLPTACAAGERHCGSA